MSWIQRKLDGSDDYDQQQVIKEYFDNKLKMQQLLQEQHDQEVKKFWNEYEDEYYNG